MPLADRPHARCRHRVRSEPVWAECAPQACLVEQYKGADDCCSIRLSYGTAESFQALTHKGEDYRKFLKDNEQATKKLMSW